MKYTAKHISEVLRGQIVGDENAMVTQPSKIEEAEEGSITFLANPKYEPYVYKTKASIVLVPKSFEKIREISTTLIKVENVYQSLGMLLQLFYVGEKEEKGISEYANISTKAKLGEGVSVGDYSIVKDDAVIGDQVVIHNQVYIGSRVKIGKNTKIYPGVKIYHDCEIGEGCIIHSNAVIGSDGFGFSRNQDGVYGKIPQIGNVVVHDKVEIGACTVIDRATMGSTIIKKGVKLDNLIQVAHNVEIGEHTAIAAQTGISGSTKIGRNCMIGGQVGFVGHIKVSDNTMVQAQSGVAGNVTQENSKLYGYPAIDYQKYLKAFAYFKKLPDIVAKIREIDKNLDKLTNQQK